MKFRLVCALLALAAPLVAIAQQTVFYDTFGSSTLNQTNAFPGGTPTASSTSYTCASAKAAPNFSIAPGHLHLYCPATSTANSEAQAMFTKFPVSLASIGDYVELTYTFTDSTNLMNGVGGNGSGLLVGLFNSGGTSPLGGTILQNGGLGGASTAYIGGTSNWLGYNAQMFYNQTAGSAWGLFTRSVQAIAQNIDQELLYNYKTPSGATLSSITPPASFPFPNLTVGSQYTTQYRITLSAVGTLTISNALYTGNDTTGALIFSNVAATVTGGNLLTTNFDGLAIGFRAGGGTSLPAWTNDINSITVVAGLAAQAGPYFTLTSGGNGCGGATIGLNGSVSTNAYLLYTNGVFNGNIMLGTGSAISFGLQTSPAVYTIYASNLVTTSVGPMYGSQTVSQTAPVIAVEPANFSCVTNAPATFTVTAVGNTLSYQWYRNGVALTNGGNFSGVQTTNLVVSPAQAADAATTANGYYVIVMDPCGESVTSSPPASLTLLAPNNLVWQGNNPNNNWDVNTALNFTNAAGSAQVFIYGDDVAFNDTSANTTVGVATNVVPSVVTVTGTQNYTFTGPGSIVGFGELIDNNSGALTIDNTNSYTGGTFISNNATIDLGNNNSGGDGVLSGVVSISPTGVLNYNYYNNQNVNNTLAGSGTVNYESSLGGTLTLGISAANPNFTGVANLVSGVRVHAQTGSTYPFGNGSTVNVQNFSQAWCDTATYNNVFNIAGTGWIGTAPPTGAISVFGSIFTGAINLTADARISGTISGGTILCPITGPYQLEVWGNPGSYVLSIGPTNGVSTYASTLITSGTVRALNTNAISTGPLTMDVAGDLRLNSYNLTVSNLASTSSGNVTGTGATIQNIGATNAILTFGADNSAQEFDGIFFNGGTGSLGITKIGTGAETLTAASTNTGPVTVSGGSLLMSGGGSFNNASRIVAGNGAVYDVTGAGGTLTLNSGQTVAGQGTVNGNVVVSSGATINPGLPTGTLTVSGSVTMNSGSTYLANLNRSSSPNCSQLSASGGFTYAGTLFVTNVGTGLQVGDSFQLFASAVTGFSSIVTETNDAANGLAYTWNNTINSDGKITVASVVSLSATVNTNAPHIQISVTGNTLHLGWPTNAGWTLLSNSVGLAATSQWFPYANSANLTNADITIDPTKANVFFKMQYPYP